MENHFIKSAVMYDSASDRIFSAVGVATTQGGNYVVSLSKFRQ